MSNIVDWATGQPLAANSLDKTRKTSAINARPARKIQEATPARLLGYSPACFPFRIPISSSGSCLSARNGKASVPRSYWLALRAISRLSSPLRRPSSVGTSSDGTSCTGMFCGASSGGTCRCGGSAGGSTGALISNALRFRATAFEQDKRFLGPLRQPESRPSDRVFGMETAAFRRMLYRLQLPARTRRAQNSSAHAPPCLRVRSGGRR